MSDNELYTLLLDVQEEYRERAFEKQRIRDDALKKIKDFVKEKNK